MENDRVTPLFLLRTVLFPQGLLALRVFEPRYLDMISASLRHGEDFGICLIRSGEEIGQGAVPAGVGTLARVVDWGGEAGVLHIQVEGQERFSIVDWEYQGQLARARIRCWPAEPILPIPREVGDLLPILAELLGDAGAVRRLDASRAGMHLAQALPAPAEDKQRLLELQDPLERLRRIRALLRGEGAQA
ncbi:LON peptidase substrate-binding domain-containing protein [Acidithiobacillus sulfuriphilus]|uniref:LON peptidase substrate-binding domain-containing protein n=1 Tax=Acidithiobacillus sulfuriphilus TaxID=1867749 RepID=UPI003F648B01